MSRSKKLLSVVAVAIAAVVFTLIPTQQATAKKATGVRCTIDMVVETLSGSSVVGTETYSRSFTLNDGETYSDDFSTPTRFKFFDASMTRLNGSSTISVDWFADVSVFNSIDFNSSVVLSKNQKIGKTVGSHTFYSSNNATRTSFALVCQEL